MVISTAQALAFAGVVFLAALTPGPDFVVVTRNSAASGRRIGMLTAAGVGLGVFVWAVAAALGIAALLATSAVAFGVVKVVGASYLLFLAVRALRSAYRGGGGVAEQPARRVLSAPAAFWQGLLTNLLNPKAAMFFVALMPQFVSGDGALGPVLLLAVVAVLVSGGWFTVLATVVGALRRFFASERVRRTLDAATGTLLVALGIRLVVQTQP